jgi:hypothetical protein
VNADKPHGRHGHKSAKHKRGGSAADETKPDAAGEPSDAAKPAAEEKPTEAPKAAAPKQTEPAPTTTQSIPSGTNEPAPSAEH